MPSVEDEMKWEEEYREAERYLEALRNEVHEIPYVYIDKNGEASKLSDLQTYKRVYRPDHAAAMMSHGSLPVNSILELFNNESINAEAHITSSMAEVAFYWGQWHTLSNIGTNNTKFQFLKSKKINGNATAVWTELGEIMSNHGSNKLNSMGIAVLGGIESRLFKEAEQSVLAEMSEAEKGTYEQRKHTQEKLFQSVNNSGLRKLKNLVIGVYQTIDWATRWIS